MSALASCNLFSISSVLTETVTVRNVELNFFSAIGDPPYWKYGGFRDNSEKCLQNFKPFIKCVLFTEVKLNVYKVILKLPYQKSL